MPVGPIESTGVRGLLITKNNVQPKGMEEQFVDFLKEANQTIKTAEQMGTDFAAGRQNNIHETMIATEQANISLRLVSAVRNRILTAYTEVMNMRL